MSDKVEVSVIVPVYNSERYVSRCVESLLNQTYLDIEIILVDDASKDGSLRCCKSMERQDSRIKVIALECNKGVSNARNAGIKMAKGKFLVFVDSDDFVSEEYIEILVKLQKQFPTSMAMSLPQEFNEDNPIETIENEAIERYDKSCFLATQYWYHPWACAAIFYKKILDDYGIYFCPEAKFGEDAYFVDKYLCFCSDVVISQARTYYYYIHSDGGAISRADKRYTSQDVEARFTSYKAYLEAANVYEKYAKESLRAINASYCFLAADILLMQIRAGDEDSNITNLLKRILNAENLLFFLRHCKYRKHKLFVIGMTFFPKLVYRILR